MTINILGSLLDPLGNPIQEGVLRFTAQDALVGSSGEFTSSILGAYDFELEIGTYLVEGNYLGDELHTLGVVVLDENTPNPVTITDLILYGSPVVPPIILEASPDWDSLFANVKALGSYQESQYQVREGDNYTSEVKELWVAPEAVMTDESLESSTLNAKMTSQVRVYEDDNLNQASTLTHEGTTSTTQLYKSLEALKASNGEEELRTTTTLNGSEGNIEQTLQITKEGINVFNEVAYGTALVQESLLADEASLVHDKNSIVGGSHKQEEYSYSPTHLGSPHPQTLQDSKLELTEVINAVTHTAEITGTKEIAISVDELASALQEVGVKVYAKEAFQRLEIDDSGTAIHTLQVDKQIIQDDAGFPLVEFDTAISKVTINGILQIQNAEDFKGDPGETHDFIYEYSKDDGVTDTYHETYDPNHPDRWRRQRKTIDGVTVGVWSDGIYLNAKDGESGDIYFNQFQYSTDDASKTADNWHVDYVTGDDWRRWRVIENGSPVTSGHDFYGPENGWWEERMKGLDGPPGWVADVQYQYSVDNLPPWHNDFITGDLYRRERVSWYASNEDFLLKDDPITPSTPALEGTWTSGAKIAPEEGVDYGDKYFTIMMYKRSNVPLTNDEPGTITYDFVANTILPATSNGWTSTVPAGEEDIWLAVGTAYGKGTTDTVDDWVVEKSVPGGYKSAVAWYYRVEASATSITDANLPIVPLTYDFLTGKVTTSSNGWSPTIPSNTAPGGKLWVTFNTALVKVAEWTDTLDVADWETPVVMVQNGVDGDTGEFKSFVFKNALTAPATPTGGTINTPPSGWTDDPVTPSGSDSTWVSVGTFTYSNGSWSAGVWSVPARYSGSPGADGTNGIDGEDSGRFKSFVYTNGSSAPSAPSGGSFNGFTETMPSGWTDSSSTPPTGQFSWVSTTTYTYNDGANSWSNSGWKVPSRFSGEEGTSGVDGSGWYYKGGVPTIRFIDTETYAWATYGVDTVAYFVGVAGRNPVNGDILVVSNYNGTYSDTGMFNDSTGKFEAIAQLISGNVLIDGTLNATKIKSLSITSAQIATRSLTAAKIAAGAISAYEIAANTITGNEISASARIIAGSGSTSAGMNGLDSGNYSGYRFWAGGADPTTANFKVSSNGSLTATNGTFSGNVTMQNAAVDTLQIAGNAVTVMGGISGSTGISFVFNHGYSSSVDVIACFGGTFHVALNALGLGTGHIDLAIDGVIFKTINVSLNKAAWTFTIVGSISSGNHTLSLSHAGTTIDPVVGHTIADTFITVTAGKR